MTSTLSMNAKRSRSYDPSRYKREAQQQAMRDFKPISQQTMERGMQRLEKPLHNRIGMKWHKDEVISGLDHRIQRYAYRHGGPQRLTKDRRAQQTTDGSVRQRELAILDKMRKDEEAGALKLPVEEATDKALS